MPQAGQMGAMKTKVLSMEDRLVRVEPTATRQFFLAKLTLHDAGNKGTSLSSVGKPTCSNHLIRGRRALMAKR